MPNQHTITIPASQATDRQLLHELYLRMASAPDHAPALQSILERITAMAEQIDRLNTAVERELADDSAQNQLIAELRAQLGQARAAAEAAEAGNVNAQAELRTALDAADAAAQRLESNDPSPEPAPEPTPEPANPPQPVDPAQPAGPDTVEPQPQPVEPTPVDPTQPQQ